MSREISRAAIRSLKSGPIKPLIERWRLFKRARPEKYGGSYLKNMWAEAPHLGFISVYVSAAMVLLAYKLKVDNQLGGKPFKDFYFVMRPDDPRVKNIQRQFYDRNEDINDYSAFTRRGT